MGCLDKLVRVETKHIVFRLNTTRQTDTDATILFVLTFLCLTLHLAYIMDTINVPPKRCSGGCESKFNIKNHRPSLLF